MKTLIWIVIVSGILLEFAMLIGGLYFAIEKEKVEDAP